MPARADIVAARDQAEAKLRRAMTALASALGLPEPPPLAYDGKNPDWNQTRELARIASFVETVAAQSADLTAALRAEIERCDRERDDALRDVDFYRTQAETLAKAMEENVAELAELAEMAEAIPGSVAELTRLTYAAADDEELRRILVDRGYLQAKEDESGVSVSWVGLAPDLDAEPATAPEPPKPQPRKSKQDQP